MSSLPVKTPTIPAELPHRIAHGSMAWATAGPARLHQPQDGAANRNRVSEIAARLRKMPGESEDARLTGGTRSLMRRLSGLNLMRPQRQSPRPAGKSVSKSLLGPLGNAHIA